MDGSFPALAGTWCASPRIGLRRIWALPSAILGLIAWYAVALAQRGRADAGPPRAGGEAFSMTTGLMHLAFVQILLGALVAGSMPAACIPAGRRWAANGSQPRSGTRRLAGAISLKTRRWCSSRHRMTAYLLTIYAVVVWAQAPFTASGDARRVWRHDGGTGGAGRAGIMNVIHASPLPLALAHQLGRWRCSLILRARHNARYPYETSVRGLSDERFRRPLPFSARPRRCPRFPNAWAGTEKR